MTTLEDKILGEKAHYYCSSDEEDDRHDNDGGHAPNSAVSSSSTEEGRPEGYHKWNGYSVNTGPKGVIKDWQKYKQFESERRANDERERLEMIKKLSISCANDNNNSSDESLEDSEDQFLKEYMMKRMEEMMEQIDSCAKDRPDFGTLIHLKTSQEFLDAIDKEKKFVTIICHIYTNDIEECQDMNGCLSCLAQQYLKVKFCAIEASKAGMSKHFTKNGVPALLVYKSGALISNYVRLTDEFQKPFYAVDIEKFLIDHGVLKEEMATNGKAIESEVTSVRKVRESSLEDQDSSD